MFLPIRLIYLAINVKAVGLTKDVSQGRGEMMKRFLPKKYIP